MAQGAACFDAPDLVVMPHKYNADRRHHIPRPKRRVTKEYNEALRQRGSLTVWFTDDAIAAWKAAPRTTPGGQPHYSDLGFQAAGSAGGISPPAAHRTVRKPLDLHGSSQPLPCHLAMTVDAESDRSSRLPGWRPPSLSWVIRFAPRSLQALRHYYRMIRPRHAHRYFPPSCFALIRFSLRMA